MMIKPYLILLLCCWLPLQSAVAELSGCEMVGHVMDNTAQAVSHHCGNKADVKTQSNAQQHHTNCNACKTHCASTSILLTVRDWSATFISKQAFIAFINPNVAAVYLDIPPRPPQSCA